ncbi:MAG TPA: ABC transporter permease [Longimicrobiales bacterium]|nr:ABC transporter permease [Longimicrobiales bacterium]
MSGTEGGGEPRLARRLLERCLPARHREAVPADLREEMVRDGRGRVWYWVQALSIAARFSVAARAGAAAGVGQDLRLAVRKLGRDRVFTVVAVLALALGIGLNATVLVVADAILFAPLPYPAEDRLAVVTNDHTGSSTGGFGVSWPNMRDVAEESRTVEDHTLFLDWQSVNYAGTDAAHRLPAAFVDQAYFRLLGLEAGVGRLFSAGENRVGAAARVAVLGRGTWERVFGADPDVVGRDVHLNGRPFRIVGVLTDDRGDLRYRWSQDPAGIFLPLFAAQELTGFDLRDDRGTRALNALLRIREGATVEDAHA